MDKVVSIVKCSDYTMHEVSEAVRHSIDLLGGLERFVRPGQRVLLKVNLLSATQPDKAVTTHPAVVAALAELIRAAGGKPLVADSPGPVPYTISGIKKAYAATGLLELEQQGLVELNWDTSIVDLPNPGGRLIKRFEVIRPVIDCDVIIPVPKLKTHMFTSLTGATKILFGVIPGFTKAGYHAKLQSGDQFAEMLLDLVDVLKPALFIMDGVLALEGDGPGLHGKPRPVGVVLASTDAVAMDVLSCALIGMDPVHVPMLRAAIGRGWWGGKIEEVKSVGVSQDSVKIPDFQHPTGISHDARGLDRLSWYQSMWAPVVKQTMTPRPVPNRQRCTGCATCQRACPQDAVLIKGKKAEINDRSCIRCYCCHEMCPEAAVDLRFGFLGEVVKRFGLLGRSR